MDDLVTQARKALDGVTEGPWIATEHRWPQQVGCCPLIGRPLAAHHDMHNVAAANTEADIQFIGTARDLVPAMADRIEALTAERDALKRVIGEAVPVTAAGMFSRALARKADADKRAIAAEAKLAQVLKVKPLVWEYHPCGAIAAPPTGHAYIIDTRMKGRVYSVKGFNPQRDFSSMEAAKAAAHEDYERRILESLESATMEAKLTADFAAAEAKLAQAVRVLIERDGGRHDDDCRHLRYIGKPCNCGHVQARAFLATIQPKGETDDKA